MVAWLMVEPGLSLVAWLMVGPGLSLVAWLMVGHGLSLVAWLMTLESVRLVKGSSRCSGRVEVKSNQSWSSVCEDDFDQQDAEVVCRELGCGAPSVRQGALYGEVEAPVGTKEFQCEGSESLLLECGTSGSDRNTCSPGNAVSVRLVKGSSRCSGRVEVKSNQSWSSVCEDDFDQQDAEVVCRELGCGAPSVLQGALYGEVKAAMGTKEFQCEGSESLLLDCGTSGSDRNTCSPGKAVGLICSGRRNGSTEQTVWGIIAVCDGSESALRECGTVDGSSTTSASVEVICSAFPKELITKPVVELPILVRVILAQLILVLSITALYFYCKMVRVKRQEPRDQRRISEE
ncbi:scavenger receptor cysteine-rich domain-containing group B protein-like [Diretmus argenteus]